LLTLIDPQTQSVHILAIQVALHVISPKILDWCFHTGKRWKLHFLRPLLWLQP